MKQYVSAIERLRSLPALFRGADLTNQFGMTAKAASQYLYLWKKQGHVVALGGHSDVWANLVVDLAPDWEAAVLMAMPSAVVVGIEPLRRAGWTTQIPARPQVAVNARQRRTQTDHFEIDFRGARWFTASEAGIVRTQHGTLRALTPAWALADMLRQEDWGDFGLQPDDIEWHEVTPDDEVQWAAACKAYGLDQPALHELAVSLR